MSNFVWIAGSATSISLPTGNNPIQIIPPYFRTNLNCVYIRSGISLSGSLSGLSFIGLAGNITLLGSITSNNFSLSMAAHSIFQMEDLSVVLANPRFWGTAVQLMFLGLAHYYMPMHLLDSLAPVF